MLLGVFLDKNFIILSGIRNFGYTEKFLLTTEQLPQTIWTSLGWYTNFNFKKILVCLKIATELGYNIVEEKVYSHFATEFGNKNISMFCEYKPKLETGKITTGISLKFKNLSFFYGVIPTNLSIGHWIGINIKF